MFKATMRSAWAEINLINLEYNLKNITAKVGSDKKIIAVVKADAYGHGAVKIVKSLKANGIDCFAVSSLEEAITLRDAGIKDDIVLFCLVPDICADVVIEYNLSPMISSFTSAKAFSDAAAVKGRQVSGFVAIDTGMGRIGFLADENESVDEFVKINELSNFSIKGLFSHFACADCEDQAFSKEQIEKYKTFIKKLDDAGMQIPLKTLSNSAAIMELPDSYYDAVRPGIILYGCYPSAEVDRNNLSIKPVLSIKACIAHIKDVDSGFSVSYGRKFISERPSKIATITIGYADGLPRNYSGKGKVIINGVFAPIIGNICMDQCMIDVTDVPNVKLGDEVIIMGNDSVREISADYIANAVGTINYEILCAFRQRLPKVYLK